MSRIRKVYQIDGVEKPFKTYAEARYAATTLRKGSLGEELQRAICDVIDWQCQEFDEEWLEKLLAQFNITRKRARKVAL